MNISDEQLLSWNRQGLIAGPKESSDAFLERIARLLPILIPHSHETAKEITATLFDFRTDWVDVRISNKGLRIWEAAATWTHAQDTPTITLKKTRRRNPSIEEIVSHEMLHVMRSLFPSSKYEECMAYCTSKSHWRRTLGPIFEAPWESSTILLLYYGALFVHVWFPERGFLAVLLPLATTTLFLLRLCQRHATMRKALSHLSAITSYPLPMLVRLTDEEIEMCAQSNAAEIRTYAQNQHCLRWRAISLAYLD